MIKIEYDPKMQANIISCSIVVPNNNRQLINRLQSIYPKILEKVTFDVGNIIVEGCDHLFAVMLDEEEKKKCTCNIQVLMVKGCECS